MTKLRELNINFGMIIIIWLLLTVVVFGPIFARADEEVMDKARRGRTFTNVDELKEYLDLVKDYFNVNGKSRYGKRGGNLRSLLYSLTRAPVELKLKFIE